VKGVPPGYDDDDDYDYDYDYGDLLIMA